MPYLPISISHIYWIYLDTGYIEKGIQYVISTEYQVIYLKRSMSLLKNFLHL